MGALPLFDWERAYVRGGKTADRAAMVIYAGADAMGGTLASGVHAHTMTCVPSTRAAGQIRIIVAHVLLHDTSKEGRMVRV